MNVPQLEQINLHPVQTFVGSNSIDPRVHSEEVLLGAAKVLLSRWKLILKVVLAALVLATGYLAIATKVYTGEAVIRLEFEPNSASVTSRVTIDPAALIESEARIIRSRRVAEAVVERLNLATDPRFGAQAGTVSRLIKMVNFWGGPAQEAPKDDANRARSPEFIRAVSNVMAGTVVENDNKSYLATVKFFSGSPEIAAAVANAIAEEFLRERILQNMLGSSTRAEAELSQLAQRLGDRHPTFLAAKDRLAEITEGIKSWRETSAPIRSAALDTFIAEIVIPAFVPTAATSPKVPVVYGLSVMLSLVGVVIILLLMERRDTGFASEEVVTSLLGIRCFGVFPAEDIGMQPASGGEGTSASRPTLLEACRSISVASGLDLARSSAHVVLVTSSLPDEYKAAFVDCLAVSLSQRSRRVLVVDAVPRPAYAGDQDSRRISSDWRIARDDDGRGVYQSVDLSNHAFISSDILDRYVKNAREIYDIVIIKAPPVLMLSDAAQLARHADSVMLLIRAHQTQRRVAALALKRLHDAGVLIGGAVLTGVDTNKRAFRNVHGQSFYLEKFSSFYSLISSRSDPSR